jgi:integrase
MAKQNLLTDKRVASAKCPPNKSIIYLNDGAGLRLKVFSTGQKHWHFRLVYNGKESTLSLGSYPTVSLAAAREKASASRLQLIDGLNPVQERRKQKRAIAASYDNLFKDIAEEALNHFQNRVQNPWSEKHYARSKGILNNYVYKEIGSVPISQIDHVIILNVLKNIHSKGAYRTSLHAKNVISCIFTYAIHANKAQHNPTDILRKNTLLTRPKPQHLKSLEIDEVGKFVYKLDANKSLNPVTKVALKIHLYTGLRVNSLRQAKWGWLDVKNQTLSIPAEFMKNREIFQVPLSQQATSEIEKLRELNDRGPESYIFRAVSEMKPISENTTTVAIKKLGFTATSHGMRTLLKRVLTKQNRFAYDAIERQLDHKRPPLDEAYMGGEDWMHERREMLSWYCDWIDSEKNKYEKELEHGTTVCADEQNTTPKRAVGMGKIYT